GLCPRAWTLYQVRTKPRVRTEVFGVSTHAGIGASDRNGAAQVCPDVRDLLVGVRRDTDRTPLPCIAATAAGSGRYARTAARFGRFRSLEVRWRDVSRDG